MGRRRAVHRVDLNTASDIQLRTLSGVGPARAQAIIKARKLKGSFACIRDITRVPGICASILDLNRSRLQCSRTRKKKLPITSTLTTEEQPCTRETRRSTRAREVAATIVAHLEMDDGNIRSDVEPSTSQTAHKSRVHLRIDDHVDVPASGDTPSPSATATPARLEPKDQVVTRSFSKSHHGSDDDNDDDDDDDDEVVAAGDSSSDGGGGEDDDADSTENSEVVGSDSESTENVGSVESFPGGASPGSPEGRETRSSKVMKRKSSVAISAHDVSPAKTKRKMLDLSIEDAQALSALTPGGRERRRSCSALSQLGLSPAVLHQEPAMDHHQTFGLPTGATSAHLTPRRRIPSRQNPPVEMADWLKVFQTWSNAERLLALDQLIELCEPTQVRHIMTVIEPQFQRDFISLLPKELALYVLSFLDPRDLLRAAQTCRYWRILAEDNLLWREKCREASIDEAVVLNKKRRPVPGPHKSQWKSAYMRQHQIEMNWRVGTIRPFKMLKGHDDHVITCLQFCGNRVVSGSDDNTLKVWSATTGKCLRTLVGHTGGVWSSQMYGNIIISGSTDRTLKVWNADTGQCIHTLYGHTSTVRCMHLHGSKVVSGSRDATLRVWDVESGECLHVLMGHVAAVRCVQYDGKRVVSGAYDYTVKVWNPETEECLHTLQGHTNRVYSLQFDGVHVVSGSLDTSIRVWEVETGNCLHTLMGHQSLTSGMELKDNTLVSGNADSTVKVWNIETGQCLQTLTGPHKHQSAVTCLQFNSKFVITSSDDGTVKLWDLKTGEFIRNLVALDSGGSGGVVWRIRANQTKLVCAVGSRNGTEETKLLVLDFDAEVK